MNHHIKAILRKLITPESSWKHMLLQNWHVIFGNLSAKITLEKIYDDTIILGVYDSCWMQELYLLSPLLLNKINKNLDQHRIKQVRFKQTGRKRGRKKIASKRKSITNETISLSTAEENILKTVTDPVLRKALKEFRIRCYRELK